MKEKFQVVMRGEATESEGDDHRDLDNGRNVNRSIKNHCWLPMYCVGWSFCKVHTHVYVFMHRGTSNT